MALSPFSDQMIIERPALEGMLPRLRRMLGVRLAGIGFFMEEFECSHSISFGVAIRLIAVCPCGGVEGISMRIEGNMPIEYIVDDAVSNFRAHIEDEVTRGILPPAWLERMK